MAWTLTRTGETTPLFTFDPAPASVREVWSRDIMDFPIPFTFGHMVQDWVSTGRELVIEGKIVHGQGGESIQAWKIKMQNLLWSGSMSAMFSVLVLDDGDPDTSLPIGARNSFGNNQNAKGVIKQIEWAQNGGENHIGYRITFVCGTLTGGI